jgi:hypothetical protein
MALTDSVARTFNMNEDSWRRHANPWSVWTRFAAIPAFALAVWSRDWIGWWSLAPVGAVVAWLFLNVVVFRPVERPVHWTSKGIFGEHQWLKRGNELPEAHRIVMRWLIAAGLAGMATMAYGLVILAPWPTLAGMAVLVLAQLWRIDRFGLLYEMDGVPEHRIRR